LEWKDVMESLAIPSSTIKKKSIIHATMRFVQRVSESNYCNRIENLELLFLQVITHGTKEIPLNVVLKATDGFSKERVVGQGGFAVVYKGLIPRLTGHQVWAVKRRIQTEVPKSFVREVRETTFYLKAFWVMIITKSTAF